MTTCVKKPGGTPAAYSLDACVHGRGGVLSVMVELILSVDSHPLYQTNAP